ncbi:CLUMA_CG010561, isoform A [Clunio marinus]|uniref:cholesterol 7-desaturase n=1 Tax=Clunio marinus TaxID=568069 RepID=A0A1J1IC86_9DIPT|nr:CLUMA_CG010561, isoform A [Clunio marinus]
MCFLSKYFHLKDLHDIGFEGKRSAINRARRLRKVGNKIPPPFPNGWFSIIESNQIQPGTANNVNCLGENFVVFRSLKSKEVFVLDAYCPHMGANLGVGGMVDGDCIECPFHQWKFRGSDGACVNIPYSDSLSEIEKSARIKKWKSREVNGLIFVWHHAEGEEPWEIPVIHEIDNNEWVFHGKNEWSSGEENKHVASIAMTHSVKFWKYEFVKVNVTVKQVGPGYVLLFLQSSFGPLVALQTVTPVEPLVQRLSHYFYGPRYLAWFIKFSLICETINVARDVMVWNHKQYVSNPLIAKEEKPIKLFRNWFGQFYSENSKTFADSNNNLTW